MPPDDAPYPTKSNLFRPLISKRPRFPGYFFLGASLGASLAGLASLSATTVPF
jgi:hypothetical protein